MIEKKKLLFMVISVFAAVILLISMLALFESDSYVTGIALATGSFVEVKSNCQLNCEQLCLSDLENENCMATCMVDNCLE